MPTLKNGHQHLSYHVSLFMDMIHIYTQIQTYVIFLFALILIHFSAHWRHLAFLHDAHYPCQSGTPPQSYDYS